MGDLSPEVLISLGALMIVSIALHYNCKGAFCMGLIFGTSFWWIHIKQDLSYLTSMPNLSVNTFDDIETENALGITISLALELTFLYILTLIGLMRPLSEMAGLTKNDGVVPGGRWLYLICGAMTVIAGFTSAAPVLISPESAAGIKAGARTGLSTCICGALFGLTAFLGPLFKIVPHAGTAPLLMMIGILLFRNVQRIDWSESRFAAPAFCCLFFIPFTYSLANGVYISLVVYIVIGMFTGDFWTEAYSFIKSYTSMQTCDNLMMKFWYML